MKSVVVTNTPRIGQSIEDVASVAGGDVDDAHRTAALPQTAHGVAQELLQVPLALPNAAPRP